MAEQRPEAATMVDAAAYHGPLSTSFQERRRVAEVSESEFEPDDVSTCRVCGCTDERACAGGCSWVEDPQLLGDLCSSCLPLARAVMDGVRAELRPVVDALLREQFNSGHLGDTLASLLEAWDVR